MNIRKITKNVLLIPYRVIQGAGDAMNEVVDPPPKKKEK